MMDDQRIDDALTDLAAYALIFEIERDRVQERVLELAATESAADERFELVRQRAEMTEELEAFRETIAALERHVRASLTRRKLGSRS